MDLDNLTLVDDNHPLLQQTLPKFDFANPPADPIEIAHALTREMIRHKGLGLSANQLGLPVRAFAMATNPVIVCFNPVLVDVSSEEILLDEGCLSYPNLFVKIPRPSFIKVRYTLPNGQTDTYKYTGMTARIWLHEFDHMEGIDFLTRAKPVAQKMARSKWKKNGKVWKQMQKMRAQFAPKEK